MTNAPLLTPLGNYGGPTPTMPPLSASPAIDAGTAGSLATDQRGFPRVIGPAADLGAAEFFYTNSVVTTTNDGGGGSLRHIIAHTLPPFNVTFDPSLSGQTIFLTNGIINLCADTTIDAFSLAAPVRLDARYASGIFVTFSDINLTIDSLIFTHRYYDIGGGALFLGGNLPVKILNCQFINNAGHNDGAVFTVACPSTFSNCVFTSNTADYTGGAISPQSHSSDSLMALYQCSFIGNTADVEGGGALYVDQPILAVNCNFTNNSGASYDFVNGGAINTGAEFDSAGL